MIERANGHLETSFLPGRTFTSPADFNAQLGEWLPLANSRRKRVLGCAPSERIEADRQAMLSLPPVAPVTGWRRALVLPRDHYVRVDANDYSIHPAVIGQRIEVVTDLHRVRAFHAGRLVADHERAWAKHQTITDPVHAEAAKVLRRERITILRPGPADQVELRPLSDYDRALGLDGALDDGAA